MEVSGSLQVEKGGQEERQASKWLGKKMNTVTRGQGGDHCSSESDPSTLLLDAGKSDMHRKGRDHM